MLAAAPHAFLLILLPAIAIGGALALPVLLALSGLASVRPSLLRQAIESRSLALVAFLGFTAWVALSALWSPYPSAEQAGKVVVLVLVATPFVILAARGSEPAKQLTKAGAIASCLVLAALLAIEAATGLLFNRTAQPNIDIGELRRNVSRGAVVLLALNWTAAAALIADGRLWRRALAISMLVGCAIVSALFDQAAISVAFGAGLIAFAVGFWRPRLALQAVSIGLAGWLLASPFLTPLLLSNQRLVDALPMSWAARAGMWEFVSREIITSPWLGHGLEASRAVTERITVRGEELNAVLMHPHSASLQIWYETGLVGALRAAAALILGGMALARRWSDNRPAAAAACASIAALGVIGNVSYGLWAEWWIATLFVTAALVAALGRSRGEG